jgi:hypothetical protein
MVGVKRGTGLTTTHLVIAPPQGRGDDSHAQGANVSGVLRILDDNAVFRPTPVTSEDSKEKQLKSADHGLLRIDLYRIG